MLRSNLVKQEVGVTDLQKYKKIKCDKTSCNI